MSGAGSAMTRHEIFVEMQNSDHTKRAYRADINKWYQFVDSFGGSETPEVAIAFKNALTETYAGTTAQRIWCTVAAYYGWMVGTGHIESSPFHGIKSPSRSTNEAPPVPSNEDVAALLRACDDGTLYGSRSKIVIALLLNGLRAQEVCDAKLADMNWDEQNSVWILDVLGKGDKWRAVPLTSDTQQAIYDHYMNHASQGLFIVPSHSQGQLGTQAVYRAVKHYAEQAGIVHTHPHALRHHYATRLVRGGIDVFTLQKLLGHARADTTQRYVSLDYSDLAKAIEIDPMHHAEFNHKDLFKGPALKEIGFLY